MSLPAGDLNEWPDRIFAPGTINAELPVFVGSAKLDMDGSDAKFLAR